MVDVGQPAPEFTARGHDGSSVTLSQFRGVQPVVLFFYPKDGTSVCTTEVCSFRDSFAAFTGCGAAVFGVSSSGMDAHRKFASSNDLPYLLLDDADKALRRAFGVANVLGVIPARQTFVIDKQGIVRHIHREMLGADEHVSSALAALRDLDVD